MINSQNLLKKFFGYDNFRPGQEEIINNILNQNDCLGIMPTGAGKSICYQIPAMLLPGVTIVISPLISLMKDQVDNLNQIGIPATFINSSLSHLEYSQTINNIMHNVYKIIYVAPERLTSEAFLNLLNNLQISMFTIDEAHCVSQWGHDFRPSYREIANVIVNLKTRPVVSAFTATATNIVKKDIKEFEGSAKDIDKNGYEKYMEKEIHEQPEVTKKMMNEYIDDNSKDVIKGMPDLSKYKNVTIVACGSAMHAGLIGKHLIEEYGDIPVNVEIASEFRYKKLFIDKDTLVIAISQSGETADTLEAVKIANEKECDTLGIVNVNGSSIARETSKVLYTKAGPEIAVATTKAYSAQVTLLSFLAYSLAKKSKDKEVLNEVSTFLSDLNRLPILMQEILNNKDEYKSLADKIYDKDNIFFIGRGIDEALCMEGSLKLKEISYIHSEAYAAGELKHGTISLIEDGTPVFGIVTDKKIADKTISNLKEVKSRGANVIYVTTNSLNKDGDFYDEKVIIPDTNPLLQPLLTILPLQLTAYYVAKNKNCDIDKPKNLAKSVTVE